VVGSIVWLGLLQKPRDGKSRDIGWKRTPAPSTTSSPRISEPKFATTSKRKLRTNKSKSKR